MSVAGPVQRLQGESLKRFAKPMLEAAVAISRRMGFRDAVPGDGAPPRR